MWKAECFSPGINALLKARFIPWLFFVFDNAEFTQGEKTCSYVNSVLFPFLLYPSWAIVSHIKYHFAQKCHTNLKIKPEDSLISLYRDDLLESLKSCDYASYLSSSLHHFDGTLHSKCNECFWVFHVNF